MNSKDVLFITKGRHVERVWVADDLTTYIYRIDDGTLAEMKEHILPIEEYVFNGKTYFIVREDKTITDKRIQEEIQNHY
ncbi:hypothetical protein M0H77_RS09815 [Providencia rettgeri]|nr:hypothetical protein [Providencia rettgeri]